MSAPILATFLHHRKGFIERAPCVRIAPMEQQTPYHRDRHRMPMNLTLIMALVVAFLGFGVIGDPSGFLLFVGLAVAAFSWLTTPKSYTVFDDRLVIMYGQPRIKVIPFQGIEKAELLTLAIGERVRVWLHRQRPVVLQPRDPQLFEAKLTEALGSYKGSYPEQQVEDEPTEEPPAP